MEKEMSKKTAKKNVMIEESKTEKILTKIFGDPQKRILARLQKKVDEINALSEKYAKKSDDELKESFYKFNERKEILPLKYIEYEIKNKDIVFENVDYSK